VFPVILKPVEDPAPGRRIAAWTGEDRLLIEISAGSSRVIRR
jgi:hypothetical protein